VCLLTPFPTVTDVIREYNIELAVSNPITSLLVLWVAFLHCTRGLNHVKLYLATIAWAEPLGNPRSALCIRLHADECIKTKEDNNETK
jgi:hypothetical protein